MLLATILLVVSLCIPRATAGRAIVQPPPVASQPADDAQPAPPGNPADNARPAPPDGLTASEWDSGRIKMRAA